MHPSPLRHLSDEALRQIKAKPESEIGGILWGRALTGSVVIEEAELVHSQALLYNSTSSDIRSLERAIQSKHASGLEVVGYFRSHIRDGLCLSAQDQELITKYLRNPEHLFLLIRPFEMGICVGAFFFWEDGRLQTDGSELEVPFLALDRQQVAENELRASAAEKLIDGIEEHRYRVAPPAYANAHAYLAPERSVAEQPPPTALPSRSAKSFWLPSLTLACLIAIAAATGATTYFVFPAFKARLLERISPIAVNHEVGLKVTRADDGQLDLTWNRKAPEVTGAQQALLTIIDGSTSKQLTIDGGQLHSGTLTYFPNGSDVQFRLEIMLNPRHSMAESVRVILPVAPATLRAQAATTSHAVESRKRQPATSLLVSPYSPVTARTLFKAPVYIPPGEVLRSRPNG